MAPETRVPRPTLVQLRDFNEAGATMAPETLLSVETIDKGSEHFNEAGATMAPETAMALMFSNDSA